MSEKKSIMPRWQDLTKILVLSLVLMAPAYLWGSGGADLHTQSLWVRNFTNQLWQGELYPRWLMDMFAGDGSPVFFYYPPLTYYITALFRSLAPLDAFGFYPMAASAWVAVFCSGITFYLWAMSETGTPMAALTGSLLYMAVPNHLATNFYQLMLFSSVWAYVWPPLMMLFARRIAAGKPYAVTGLAVSLCLLIMTNLPMTVMFGPLAVLYGLVNFSKASLMRQSLLLAFAVTLGFGLASVYLLPALFYQSFANVDLHWKDFGSNNVWSGSEFFLGFDTAPHTLNTLYFLISAAALLLYASTAPRSRDRLFWLGISLAVFFMMLPVSGWAWAILPSLKLLQYPERFFAVLALCCGMLASLSASRSAKYTMDLMLLSVIATIFIAYSTRTTPESYQAAKPLEYAHYEMGIDQYAEYLTSMDLIKRYDMAGLEKIKAHPDRLTTVSGDAIAQITLWRPRDIAFHYWASAPSALRVRQFDFPGFEAEKDGAPLELTREDETGEILINLPPGDADVTLRLTALLPEMAGKLLTLLCAGILSLWLLLEMRQRPV